MVRILGSTATRRRRGYQLGALVSLVALLALIAVPNALAIHDVHTFQLDGNAQSAVQSSPTAVEDWDLICKAHLSTLTPPGTCVKNPTFTFPSYGTLAAGIDSSQTSIAVNETTAPVGVPFGIQIDLEQMKVTANTPGPSATYTVVRGFNGTTAIAHSSGATVFMYTLSNPNQFVVDPSESATDDILKGGTKDDNDISSWKWTSAKPSPPKNDITDAYAAEYTCGGTELNSIYCTGTPGNKLLYFGGDRFSNSGSANLAFWFFQKRITQKLADGTTDAKPGDVCTVSAGCNFGGVHTAGNVSLGGTTPGDILVISAFGPKAQIQVYEWVGVNGFVPPAGEKCFTNTCSLVPLIPATAGQACPDVTNDNACAVVNDSVQTSPWILNQKGASANSFQPTNFYEGGIDLTQLGLAGACFSSFLMNTRASASGDAELHDKVIGQFQRCAPALTTQAKNDAGAAPGSVSPGTPVHDTATVTVSGATSPDDATGTVKFFLCGPNATANPNCSTGGTQIGSPVTLTGGTNTTDGISSADSLKVNCTSNLTGCAVVTPTSVNPLAAGRYCFRAEATLTNYDNPDPYSDTSDTGECFRVTDTSSMTTAQNWLPNDKATVTSGAGSPLSGTLSFTLYEGSTCTGTVLYPGATTLAAAIDSSQTSITVTSAGGFPNSGNYTIQVDSEKMLVTGGQGTTTWTVTRGVGSTVAAAHSSGATVTGISEDVTLTSAASGVEKTTSNTTFKITSGTDRTFSWKVVFTSSDPNVASPSTATCETSKLTIAN